MSGTVYALYKGDEFIDMGTADELAKRRNVKPESIRWLATPSARKRGGLAAYRIESVEESGKESK